MSVPFVGRADELRALSALLAGARRAGAPTVALVTGEPGSGKSRLLRETLRDSDPARTVRVAGFEPIEPIPLAAVGDLVRALAGVPEHGPRLEALVFGSSDRSSRSALPVFEAAHRALSAFGPLVLAVDDLQWVDSQSMALLHYIVRAAEATRHPLAVIVASRPSAAAATFRKGVEDPIPEGRRLAIELHGLGKGEGVALVRAIDQSLDERAAENVWRLAAGSPFWLEALAREGGTANARELIGDRLGTLSPDAARVASALAVVARPAARDELIALLSLPASRLDEAVREVVTRGLATELPGAVRLAHDLIREAAFESVPQATRRQLHAGLAELIETSAGEDLAQLTEALDHRAAAGLPTSELATRIVTSPSRRLISTDLLRHIAVLADQLRRGSPEQQRLDAGLGRLAAELGEHELAMRHWGRVAEGAADPGTRLEASLAAARAAYILRRGPEVHAHIARARALPTDRTMAISLDAFEADVAMWLDHDTVAGAALAERAISWHDVSGGRDAGISTELRTALVAAYDAAADAAMQQDRGQEVIRLSDMAFALADGLGEEARLEAFLRTGMTRRSLGMVEEAEARWRAGREAADRLILPVSSVEAGIGLARVLRDQGRFDEALTIARETAALEARIGSAPQRWGTAHAVLLWVELGLDGPGAVDRLREAALRFDPHYGIGAHQSVATWIARHDGTSRAALVVEELEMARESSAIVQCRRCARELTVVSAELLARIGDVAAAKRQLADWEAGLAGPSYVMRDLWRARAHAAIALAAGTPEAGAFLSELAAAFEGAGFLEDAAWAYVDLGSLLRESGDRAGAVAAFTAAASLSERGGATGVGRLASRALRELGVRAWRRGSARGGRSAQALGQLSGREREIAQLVAAGASNREIAEALMVSPKTVERHVTNILAKVGARNRTELARCVHAESPTEAPA